MPGGARVLDDRDRHAGDVRLLKRHRPGEVRGDLTADKDRWDRIHPRVGHGGQQVDRAGSRRRQRDARLARDPCPSLCRVSGRGLMSHQHMPDRTPGEGVIERQHSASRNAEDRVDPTTRQRVDQGIGAAHPPLLRRRWWSRCRKTGTRTSEVMTSLQERVGEREPAPSAGLRAGRDRRRSRKCRSQASPAGSYRSAIAAARTAWERTSGPMHRRAVPGGRTPRSHLEALDNRSASGCPQSHESVNG